MSKFLADLNGEATGRITIADGYFIWKPLLLTKILRFGMVKEIVIPINQISVYKLSKQVTWKWLDIGISENQMIHFTCSSPVRIVEELKMYNPYIRMIE